MCCALVLNVLLPISKVICAAAAPVCWYWRFNFPDGSRQFGKQWLILQCVRNRCLDRCECVFSTFQAPRSIVFLSIIIPIYILVLHAYTCNFKRTVVVTRLLYWMYTTTKVSAKVTMKSEIISFTDQELFHGQSFHDFDDNLLQILGEFSENQT